MRNEKKKNYNCIIFGQQQSLLWFVESTDSQCQKHVSALPGAKARNKEMILRVAEIKTRFCGQFECQRTRFLLTQYTFADYAK